MGAMAASVFLSCLLLAGCAGGDGQAQPTAGIGTNAVRRIEAWTTTSDHRLALAPSVSVFDASEGDADIEVDAARKYQRMVGFGASITDASAWLIQHLSLIHI